MSQKHAIKAAIVASENNFAGQRLREIRRAVKAVARELGPGHPVSIAMALGWEAMRARVLSAIDAASCDEGSDVPLVSFDPKYR